MIQTLLRLLKDSRIRRQICLIAKSCSSATAAAWGTITGNIVDQTDLSSALNAKADLSEISLDAIVTTNGNITNSLTTPITFLDNSTPTRKATINMSGFTAYGDAVTGAAFYYGRLYDNTATNLFATFGSFASSSTTFGYTFIGAAYNNAIFKANNAGIGIGISSSTLPAYPLDVVGSVRLQSYTGILKGAGTNIVKNLDVSALTPIASPSTATTTDVANLLNSLLSILQA